MNEDQTSITCNNVAACSNVTVTVHTQDNEERPRKSPGGFGTCVSSWQSDENVNLRFSDEAFEMHFLPAGLTLNAGESDFFCDFIVVP
ncbi:hypothetical protein MRX96_031376 [Rhipicephalus microplus]